MKRFLLPFVAVALIFVSCASSPDTKSNGNTLYGTGDNKNVTPTKEVDRVFEEVYNNYGQVLILDGAQKYKVSYGDTLSSIAKNFYGKDSGYYFPLIMLASSQTILDPDKIHPGITLTVPDLQKNLQDTSAQQSMKKYFYEIADVYKTKKTATSAKTRQELIKIADKL